MYQTNIKIAKVTRIICTYDISLMQIIQVILDIIERIVKYINSYATENYFLLLRSLVNLNLKTTFLSAINYQKKTIKCVTGIFVMYLASERSKRKYNTAVSIKLRTKMVVDISVMGLTYITNFKVLIDDYLWLKWLSDELITYRIIYKHTIMC